MTTTQEHALLRQITSPTGTILQKPVSLSALRKQLNREHRRGSTWRMIAGRYQVNVKYVYDLAVHRVDPQNIDIRRKLGLRLLKPPGRGTINHALLPAWVTQAADHLRELEEKELNRRGGLHACPFKPCASPTSPGDPNA